MKQAGAGVNPETIAIRAAKCQYQFTLWRPEAPMPYSLEVAPAQRIFRCRFDGELSVDVLRDFIAEASQFVIEYGHGSMIGIIDFSDVATFDLSPLDIRELASLPPVIEDREAMRFIIAPSPVIFGLARMFELLGQETRPNLHVVRSSREIWVILGYEEPKFGPIELSGERPKAEGA